MEPVTVIGAGLAGSECAWRLARQGHSRDPAGDEAREDDPRPCDPMVCRALLLQLPRGAGLENAVGLLKEEPRRLDSLILRCADATAVPAGGAWQWTGRALPGW